MSRWFRFYDAVLDDPKVQRLPDAAFRAWVNLMCLASKNGGKISADWKDLSFALRKSEGKTRDLIQVLISSGLIDQSENGLEPHNWGVRQYKSDVSTGRVKRFRERLGNGDGTPPEEDTESDTETDSEKDVGAEPLGSLPTEFIRLPTNRHAKAGEEFAITEAHVAEFKALYPSVDVEAQLRAMRGWSITNSDKRKTRKGMLRFVNSWLSNEQNKSRAGPQRSGAPAGDYMRSGQVISLVKQ